MECVSVEERVWGPNRRGDRAVFLARRAFWQGEHGVEDVLGAVLVADLVLRPGVVPLEAFLETSLVRIKMKDHRREECLKG